jgi:hypothetical protein
MNDLGRAFGARASDREDPTAGPAPGKRSLAELQGEGESIAAEPAARAGAGAAEDLVTDRAVAVAPAPHPDNEPAGAIAAAPAAAAPEGAAPSPHDTPGPAPTGTPAGPAPTGTPAGPGASVASTFNATEIAHPTAPAFGEVNWNAHEPVATYAAYRAGSTWRFRLETLSLRVPVGVASGGRTNVPSATAPVVTSSTWRLVASDLAPAGGTPNRSPRTTYWAEDLTWIHERFHFNEFNTFLRTSFGSFETTIEGAGYTEPVSGASDTEAAALGRKAADLRTRLLAAWNQAKTNMSPGMEDRAYDDGVARYQARADAVRARARTAGWVRPGGP